MMTEDQVKTVKQVYNHLLEKETRGWDELDDYMDQLEYLSDDQLQREAEVLYIGHKNASVRCQQIHSKEKCLMPLLVEAVGAILDLHKETGQLHIKNRYILQYYLTMNQAELIIVEQEEPVNGS